MYTKEFLEEALCFLNEKYPTICDKIREYEDGQTNNKWSEQHESLYVPPSNMFTHLLSSVIYQKVRFYNTTIIKKKLIEKLGCYVFTSKMIFDLGKEWFERPELDMEETSIENLWRLVLWCRENGDPGTPEDVYKIQKEVRGIGPWTIHVTMLYWSIARVPPDNEEIPDGFTEEDIEKIHISRSRQRQCEVYPHLITSWDPVIRKGLYVLLGEEMYTGKMRELAKEFGKYGGLISLYMWWNFNHKKIAVPKTYKDWKLVKPR